MQISAQALGSWTTNNGQWTTSARPARKTRCRCFFPSPGFVAPDHSGYCCSFKSADRLVWRNPRCVPHRSEPPHGGDTSDTSLSAEGDRCATGEANITRGARNVCGIAPNPVANRALSPLLAVEGSGEGSVSREGRLQYVRTVPQSFPALLPFSNRRGMKSVSCAIPLGESRRSSS